MSGSLRDPVKPSHSAGLQNQHHVDNDNASHQLEQLPLGILKQDCTVFSMPEKLAEMQ